MKEKDVLFCWFNRYNMNKPVCIFILSAFILLFTACGDEKKKKSLSGDDPVEITDFIEFFPTQEGPWQFGDTVLTKKQTDSLLISYKIFSQFVPDSFITKMVGKGVKPKFYPLANVQGEDKQHFLFSTIIASGKKAVLVAVFDKKNQFVTAMPVLVLDAAANTQQSVSINKRNTITKSVSRKNADESISQGQEVYDLDAGATSFALVMTDALDEKVTELINPIDSSSRKQKFTADYSNGKMNLVSIRDGRKDNQISFFVHFEKSNGECTGELKGEAMMVNATTAEYRVGGDPCILQFKFSANAVTLKEVEGCGAKRGLRCSFDGVYPRKKTVEKKTAEKKPAKAKK